MVQVVGPSGSGKTTLIERLLPRLAAQGLRVGVIKHAHDGFAWDRPGKDSWRYAQAGAAAIAVSGPGRAAWMVTTATELPLEDIARHVAEHVELLVIEGFHQVALPRIHLVRESQPRVLREPDDCRIGVLPEALSDDELAGIVQFIVQRT